MTENEKTAAPEPDPVPDSDKDKAASAAAAAAASTPVPTPSDPASASAGETKRLRVVSPMWVQAFNFGEDDKGAGKISVTRDGSDVPAGQADSVIEEASKHGVIIEEVSK